MYSGFCVGITKVLNKLIKVNTVTHLLRNEPQKPVNVTQTPLIVFYIVYSSYLLIMLIQILYVSRVTFIMYVGQAMPSGTSVS